MERKCGNPVCSRFDEVLKPEWGTCPYCGWSEKDEQPPVCPQCGRAMEPDFIRCPFCGSSLFGEASVKEAPAKVLRIGPSPWERFVSWWRPFWGSLTPSAETKETLRNIGRAVIILVVMGALIILVSVALLLLSQAVTQKWAFLGFVSVFATLAALGFIGELSDDWWMLLLVGAVLLALQLVIGGVILADDWALQAALSSAFVSGAYLARRLFLDSKIQAAYDEGRALGNLEGEDKGWNQAVREMEALKQQEAAEDPVELGVEDAMPAEEADESYVLPPFVAGGEEW